VIPGAVLGWDMGAALAMARALGVDTLIAAELLPEIEAVMVRKLNEQIGEARRDPEWATKLTSGEASKAAATRQWR
jgi:hypothetical protein